MEIIRHRASFMNSLATAVISGGIIVPAVALFSGSASSATTAAVISVLSGICLTAGASLHELGASVVAEIDA